MRFLLRQSEASIVHLLTVFRVTSSFIFRFGKAVLNEFYISWILVLIVCHSWDEKAKTERARMEKARVEKAKMEKVRIKARSIRKDPSHWLDCKRFVLQYPYFAVDPG